MKITKELLQTITQRGENLKKSTEVDHLLHTCLRSAINGFDSESFKYDEKNPNEVEKMEKLKEQLDEIGIRAYFDGDEGNMYLFVVWY